MFFLFALAIGELAVIIYQNGIIKCMDQDNKTLSDQNNRLTKVLTPSMTELETLVKKIMNHKFEPRDNKHTVASARKQYAKEILNLFGIN